MQKCTEENISICSDMQGLSLSLSSSSTNQQLSVTCKSSIVMTNHTRGNKKVSSHDDCRPPLKKLRKENSDTMKKDDRTGTSDNCSPVDALREGRLSCQSSACFIISTSLPEFFSAASVEVAVIASWSEEDGADNWCVKSRQLCCSALAASDVCSKELEISPECLQYWTGRHDVYGLLMFSFCRQLILNTRWEIFD